MPPITDCSRKGDNLSGHPAPLIVGIDPGTTTAVAVLDTGGNLIFLFSKKNLTRGDLSRKVSGLGKPVIVAADRRPAPSAVERVASTFSARLVIPEENLSRRDKNRAAREFVRENGSGPTLNRHERDALASALFAYNSVKTTMKRVDHRLKALGHSEDEDLARFVKTRVILHGDHVKRALSRYPE